MTEIRKQVVQLRKHRIQQLKQQQITSGARQKFPEHYDDRGKFLPKIKGTSLMFSFVLLRKFQKLLNHAA